MTRIDEYCSGDYLEKEYGTKNVHFSSKTDMWSTPQYLFDTWNFDFKFVWDVCATKENSKCGKNYFDKDDDGLLQPWDIIDGWKWMNPPYGREIGKWIEKASKERKVVALLPARTDTKYFHNFIYGKTGVEVIFLRGRLKFGDSKNSAPFPSMIVIFN